MYPTENPLLYKNRKNIEKVAQMSVAKDLFV